MTKDSIKASEGGLVSRLIDLGIRNKPLVLMGVVFAFVWGLYVAPFDWRLGGVERDPVPVDAIPDIGENQQIVFTEWEGRSPQDVEDQVTYPLTVSLMGVPGVKTVRSYSMLGYSSIYVVFNDDVEFYWSRSRLLERLNSLSKGTLPEGVQPTLGPDATALGQVFWYTLEGVDSEGNPTGGWDLDELRSIQDWYVRFGLLSTEGVGEVASVGGFVREYQIDVDPDSMRAYEVSLKEVYQAVQKSNVDVGARTIEVNQVEYVIRGLGFIESLDDVESTVIAVRDNVPVYVRNVATVRYGPALRRGALDKEGAEAVGGVVVVRYGENPLEVIKNVKAKIAEMAPGLPSKSLADGRISQVAIVPFYDRTGLIHETLDTLGRALSEEVLITMIVVILMMAHFRSSLLVTSTLPLAVLLSFVGMKVLGVDANVVALSGIAIAIGTMVDMGIVVSENIVRHLEYADDAQSTSAVISEATREVGSAVFTAVATTIVSFLPVFTMEAAEGKLFKPLAWTKTLALAASVLVALFVIPLLANVLLGVRLRRPWLRRVGYGGITVLGFVLLGRAVWPAFQGDGLSVISLMAGVLVSLLGLFEMFKGRFQPRSHRWVNKVFIFGGALFLALLLARHWQPLGPASGHVRNVSFVVALLLMTCGGIQLFLRRYRRLLAWCLINRLKFLLIPACLVFVGLSIWLGMDRLMSWLPASIRSSSAFETVVERFPGLGKEFMPPLDEGAFLYMPTTMPHASIGESMDALRKQDMAIRQIPEVKSVVGKIGRAESPLDPAPISMVETIINYHDEYLHAADGSVRTFRFDRDGEDWFRNPQGERLLAEDGQPYKVRGSFLRDENGELIEQADGHPFRLWRRPLEPQLNPGRKAWEGVRQSDDIWRAIVAAAQIPGSTSAPKLQPISARIAMLQSGMRAPMGIKVKGPDLESIERFGLELETILKGVEPIDAATVFADRIVGKPYLEIDIDRAAIARFGISIAQVQEVIEVGIGGKRIGMTVEGRERYPIRVRYLRELRDQIESLEKILVSSDSGAQIPLGQLAEVVYRRGPQSIKSEDGFLIGYVLFDKREGWAEVDVVGEAEKRVKAKIESGELTVPNGVSFSFAGSFENQVRSEKRLKVVLPLALLAILTLLYWQFRSFTYSCLVFSGIAVAWAGGFILLWCYGQDWFLDLSLFGTSMKALFQIHPINLSVAVWVGFLALFGIATDDGVLMTTYLEQTFARTNPRRPEGIVEATIEAGCRRIRPCLMTTATTVLALVPVLCSSGRGADVMIPMAIPTVGGMIVALISVFVVPVLYSAVKEFQIRTDFSDGEVAMASIGSFFLVPVGYCSWKRWRESAG